MSWTAAPQGVLPPATLTVNVVSAGNEPPAAGPMSLGVATFEPVDLTTVISASLEVQAPDGSKTTWAATYAPADSLSVTGATNASPIVLTLPNTEALVGLGCSVTVAGITGNTAANGQLFAQPLGPTTAALYVDAEYLLPAAGNADYIDGGTCTPNATGTVTHAFAAATDSAPQGDLALVGVYSVAVALAVSAGTLSTTAAKIESLPPFA